MAKNQDKDKIRQDAETERRLARSQESLAKTTEEFGREDRETSKGIRDLLEPFAALLRSTYNPEDYADVVRPDRPDFSPQYEAEHKRELVNIEDDYNTQLADAADYAAATGLKRTGVPGMAVGQLAGGKAALRTGSRQNLTDRLTGEKEAGWMDKLQAYYDAQTKRESDVGIATTGANISAGQQAAFNPAQWYGQTGGNLQGAAGTAGGAANTQNTAAQIPSTWAKIGGAVSGIANTASKFTPAGWFSGGAKAA
jgi:hypothetical protein